jgi:hypothetical protein
LKGSNDGLGDPGSPILTNQPAPEIGSELFMAWERVGKNAKKKNPKQQPKAKIFDLILTSSREFDPAGVILRKIKKFRIIS